MYTHIQTHTYAHIQMHTGARGHTHTHARTHTNAWLARVITLWVQSHTSWHTLKKVIFSIFSVSCSTRLFFILSNHTFYHGNVLLYIITRFNNYAKTTIYQAHRETVNDCSVSVEQTVFTFHRYRGLINELNKISVQYYIVWWDIFLINLHLIYITCFVSSRHVKAAGCIMLLGARRYSFSKIIKPFVISNDAYNSCCTVIFGNGFEKVLIVCLSIRCLGLYLGWY